MAILKQCCIIMTISIQFLACAMEKRNVPCFENIVPEERLPLRYRVTLVRHQQCIVKQKKDAQRRFQYDGISAPIQHQNDLDQKAKL